MRLRLLSHKPLHGGRNPSKDAESKMSSTKNVKILTWIQLCTVVVVVLTAWLYIRPQRLASAATGGIIDGILFSPDNPSVLIDGQVLKVGDTIYGVEIVEIGRRIVTFEKNGKRWEQRVRERPNRAWEQSDASPISDANDVPVPVAQMENLPASKRAVPQANPSPISTSAPPMPHTCSRMPTENTGLWV